MASLSKVVFFGTPQFAADVLAYLIDHQVEVAAVVTRTDKPKGRSGTPSPSPVKLVAQQHNLPLHQPVKCSAPEFVEVLRSYEADLFVVVAYGEIVKEAVLATPKRGCINLHASLLPKYRGAAPIHRAVIEGEKETGVCIIHMVKEMDAGNVIATRAIPISPDATCGEVELDLRRVGAEVLLDVIHRIGPQELPGTPQDVSKVTFAKKIELEECRIDWSQPAETVHNLVRGTNPAPGAWTLIRQDGTEKRLKVLRTSIEPNQQGTPGTILSYGSAGLIIACGTQAVRLLEVKPEGKRAMTAEEMMRGVHATSFSIV